MGSTSDVVPNPLAQLSLAELRTRTSVKWRTYAPDVLPLWVAEMDVLLAAPIVAAVTDAVRSGDTGYAAGSDYAEALHDFAVRRWGWDGIAVERTAMVADVMTGVAEMLRLVTDPGSPVVLNCPVYTPFYRCVEHQDRQVIEAPLTADGRIDPATLERAFHAAAATGRRAAYLLCSPHNPTGTLHTRAELENVAALALEYRIRVVVDEIHALVVALGATFTPYLAVDPAALSLMSASKAFNLAGLKTGLAVAGPDAADDLGRLPVEVTHGAGHLAAIAHTVALNQGDGWLDALLAGIDENRSLLADLVADQLAGVSYTPNQATYLAWLDCRDTGLGDDPAAAFLDRGRVALSPGPSFGTGGAGFVRLNLATSPVLLREAAARMASVLR